MRAMIYRSPLDGFEIPPVSVPDFVLAGAAARGARAALIDPGTGRMITYAELPRLVDRATATLARAGVKKGDVCAIFSPNTPEYAIAVLAVMRLGAVVTTASPLCPKGELVKQLQDAKARVLLTSPALLRIAEDAAREAAVPLMQFAELQGDDDQDAAGCEVAIAPEDLAALPYSSGTTGLPKGVMLSHRNLVVNLLQVDSAGHLRDGEDTLIAFLPFFHIYGLTVLVLLALRSGATLVVMPRFELEPYLDLVERYRATVLHVVPPVVLALAKHPAAARRDFSGVRKIFSAAAPLGADVIAQATARVGCMIQQGYGMTEASPATHITPESGPFAKPGSIGIPVAHTECRIVDIVTGQDVAPGEDGEIWVRGPQVMQGYFNRPDDTRATVDEDGWLHTGDIGHIDEDGCTFVVDRLKELIKYKGLQIPPAELEAVLLSHPAVADAGVIPRLDEDAGEVPHAYVVLKGSASAEDLMAFVAERVSPYKKVRHVTFIDAIPKSPSGKILRRVLRDMAAVGVSPQR